MAFDREMITAYGFNQKYDILHCVIYSVYSVTLIADLCICPQILFEYLNNEPNNIVHTFQRTNAKSGFKYLELSLEGACFLPYLFCRLLSR